MSLNLLYLQSTVIDINTRLSALKWKTYQSRIKFFFHWIFALPMRVIYREKLLKALFLSFSFSHWYHWLCRPNPVKLTPCGKKNAHKYLKLNPLNRTSFVWQPNSSDLSYPEILTGAPNWEDREDKTYKLSKKKSHSQGCQLDLNLVPESWRLPHQIQSYLAQRFDIMTSLGPDWRHDKLCRCYGVPDLLPVPSPSSLGCVLTAKGSADTVWVCNVTVCAWLLSLWSWVRSLLLVPAVCCSRWENGT